MARDDQLIENLRARTWPGDCEAAAFRIEELLARVASLEAERASREKQEPVGHFAQRLGRFVQLDADCWPKGHEHSIPLYADPPVSATARPTDSDNHANELRRMARKIGHPAGDMPAVMRAAADRIDELERLVAAFQRAEAGGGK